MVIKFILNILINMALIVLVLGLIWEFNNRYYPLMVATIFVLALFIFFKIRLARSVRELTKKR